MKSQATWGALGVLALAGAAGVWFRTGNAPGSNARHDDGQVQARRNAGSTAGEIESNRELACDDIAQALEDFLAVDEVPRPKSCSIDSSTGVPSKQKQDNHANHRPTFNLKFVVATLPDPIHTH